MVGTNGDISAFPL